MYIERTEYVFLDFKIPWPASDMEFLEVLTEGLDRVLMVRGSGREVITIYSWWPFTQVKVSTEVTYQGGKQMRDEEVTCNQTKDVISVMEKQEYSLFW